MEYIKLKKINVPKSPKYSSLKKKNPYAFFNPIILMSVLTKPFKTHLFLLSSVSVSFLFPPPYSHTSC